MKMREKILGILARAASDGHSLDTRIETEKLADCLIENNVTVLAEDEIILTRAEIEALNEYSNRIKKIGAKDAKEEDTE